jgi:hypothetical protein
MKSVKNDTLYISGYSAGSEKINIGSPVKSGEPEISKKSVQNHILGVKPLAPLDLTPKHANVQNFENVQRKDQQSTRGVSESSAPSKTQRLWPRTPARRAKERRRYKRTRAAAWAYKVSVGCKRCGYNRCPSALHFHHPDPTTKDREPCDVRSFNQLEKLKALCDVLCANCHAEEHHYETYEADHNS